MIRSGARCYIPDNYAIKATHADNEYYSKMAATSCWWEQWLGTVRSWSGLHHRAQQPVKLRKGNHTVLRKPNSPLPLASLLRNKYSPCYKAASFIVEITPCNQGLVFPGEEDRNIWQSFPRATESRTSVRKKYGPTSAVSDTSQKSMRHVADH